MRLLSAPSRTELVQRLTALDVCVWEADNVAAVYSLAALRHLRLWSAVKNTALEMFAIEPGAQPPPCQLSELRTLQLHDIWPEAFFIPGVGASLQQLRSVCLCDCLFEEHMPDVPDELLRLPSLERLELIRLPLLCLPDMRELPALRTLVVSDGPMLRSDFAPMGLFGRATALTHLSLHDTPVEDEEVADAIERMPHLKELRLDFWGNEGVAFWAATLQRRLQGRCSVRPASKHSLLDWAGDDGDWL